MKKIDRKLTEVTISFEYEGVSYIYTSFDWFDERQNSVSIIDRFIGQTIYSNKHPEFTKELGKEILQALKDQKII
jgi:hypothetical protein